MSRLAFWNGISWAATALYGFATIAILFRHLGPATYGIWATIAALKAFTTFLDSGLAFGVARDAARLATDPTGARLRLHAAGAVCLLLGAGAIALGLTFSWLPAALLALKGDDAVLAATVMALVALDAGLAVATSSLRGTMRGLERYDVLALTSVTQAIAGVTLLLVLTPLVGLTGAAIALLVARSLSIIPGLAWLQRTRPGLIGYRSDRRTIAAVAGFAIPLWLMGLGTQVGLGTDVPIVSAFFGATAAASFAVGSVVPAVSLSLLYAIVDSAYPRLAGATARSSSELALMLIFAATMLAGLGFGVILAMAPTLLEVWLGTADPLSIDVMRVYAVTWALNVPAHILALQAIAAHRHRVLAPVVLAEATASFAVSVVLASFGSPLGPAIGTLGTLAISNLVIVPMLLLPGSGLRARRLVEAAVVGYVAGLSAAGVISVLADALDLRSVPRLALVVGLVAVTAAAMLELGVRRHELRRRIRRWPRRVWALARHQGYRTYLRQRTEVRELRESLARARREQPIIWIPSAPPLVTVRIATYNRGLLVRDRAIASALDQTYKNLEILVIGDHCDPATEAAVRSVRDPRVRFENLARRGDYPLNPMHRWMVAGAAPMNRALEIARGDWIAPLDDDDEFTPDHVAVLLDACRERELEFAFGRAETEVEEGEWKLVGQWPLAEAAIIHAAVLYASRLRTVTLAMDSWRLNEPADWNLWHRMRAAGVRMGFVDRVVCRHYLERREAR